MYYTMPKILLGISIHGSTVCNQENYIINPSNISKNVLEYGVDAGATWCAASMNIANKIDYNCFINAFDT